MSDFIPTHLSFNSGAFMEDVKRILDTHLDDLSTHLKNVVIGNIFKNGNGSTKMRLVACAAVRETKRSISNSSVILEVGIDMKEMRGHGEDVFVCVSVVLHGNMQGDSWTWRDARVMYTKPGEATWGKHVEDKRIHVPADQKPRAMPGFAQPNKIDDILSFMDQNIENEIGKYVDDYQRNTANDIRNLDWPSYIIVG